MLGNGQTRMSQALRNEGKGCPVTLENCGERVPCGVCGEGRDAYLPGYLLQRQVTQVYDLPHKVGGAEIILCRACVRENICIGVAVVRIPPLVYNGLHLAAQHSPYHLGLAVGMHGLGADETDFTVAHITVFQEKHVPEIDAVAQIGKEPQIPVALLPLGPLEVHYLLDVRLGKGQFPFRSLRDRIPASAERGCGFLHIAFLDRFVHDTFEGPHIYAHRRAALALLLPEILTVPEPLLGDIPEQDFPPGELLEAAQSGPAPVIRIHPAV